MTTHRCIISGTPVRGAARIALLLAAIWPLAALAQSVDTTEAGHGALPTDTDAFLLEAPARQSYRLGNGLQILPGWRIGGYGEMSLRDEKSVDPALTLDRLSLMSWWHHNRWSLLGEAELIDTFTAQHGENRAGEATLVLERLHIDYAFSDWLQLRVGKFLTPVGRWNLLHAAPLTWTTSRPLITEATFPTNATGAMLRGIVPVYGQTLEWMVYGSPGEELAPEPRTATFREAYGLRLVQHFGADLQIGFSAVDFRQDEDPRQERRTLYSADFLWSHSGFEISGEYAVRVTRRSPRDGDEEGLYVQAVLPLAGRLSAVLRYEDFAPVGSEEGLHLYIGGLAWRLSRALVLKAEYRNATENGFGTNEGFVSSVAVFF